jgi:hypothetical protein
MIEKINDFALCAGVLLSPAALIRIPLLGGDAFNYDHRTRAMMVAYGYFSIFMMVVSISLMAA